MMTNDKMDSNILVLKHLTELLDLAASAPPMKLAVQGRKGFARQMLLTLIDDVLRLDGGLEGADWSSADVERLKQKATRALQALNDIS